MGLPNGTPALSYLVPESDNNIPALLRLANSLQTTLPPVFGWADLTRIVLERELGLLHRHPIMEQVYIHKFTPLVKEEYGGAVAYLRKVLGWPEGEAGGDDGAGEGTHWTRTDEVVVRKNDWAYSIPHEAEHFVCWTRLPIFHPSLCTPSPDILVAPPPMHTWEDVQALGLGGATGTPPPKPGDATAIVTAPAVAPALDPGREIAAFVAQHWPVKEWETLWFANPPHLQSVPGLSHWHVMVRRKEKGTCNVNCTCPIGGTVWAER